MMFLLYKAYLLSFVGRDEGMYGKPRNPETGTRNPQSGIRNRNPDFGFRIPAFPYAQSSRVGVSFFFNINYASFFHEQRRTDPWGIHENSETSQTITDPHPQLQEYKRQLGLSPDLSNIYKVQKRCFFSSVNRNRGQLRWHQTRARVMW